MRPSASMHLTTIFALKVDRQYQGFDVTVTEPDYRYDPERPNYRRFFPNETAYKRIQEWQDQLDVIYIQKTRTIKKDNPVDPNLKIPMLRVFYEAGWGCDMGTRAAAHEDHKASNNLWTFYLALLAHTFTGKFEVKRFLINRLPHWDDVENVFEDSNVSDVAMSIIT